MCPIKYFCIQNAKLWSHTDIRYSCHQPHHAFTFRHDCTLRGHDIFTMKWFFHEISAFCKVSGTYMNCKSYPEVKNIISVHIGIGTRGPRGPWPPQKLISVFWPLHYFSILFTELAMQLAMLCSYLVHSGTSYYTSVTGSYNKLSMSPQQFKARNTSYKLFTNFVANQLHSQIQFVNTFAS